MSENRHLGEGIGMSGEWQFPRKSPYETDEVPVFPEEEVDVSDFRTPENEIDVDLSDLAPPKKSKYEVSPLNSQNPNLFELSPEEKNEAIQKKFAEVEGEDLTHTARELPPPLPKETARERIASDIKETLKHTESVVHQRILQPNKPLTSYSYPSYLEKPEEFNATDQNTKSPASLRESLETAEIREMTGNSAAKRKEKVSDMFQSLGIEFDITLNPDGSVPRGGILGRNKRHFEKLSKTNPEFVKKYETLLAEYQRADTLTQPLLKKQPSRAAAGILAAGLASGAMGSTLERRAEADRQQQKIEKAFNAESKKELTDMSSKIKSAKEVSNKIPLDASTEYTTLPETKTQLRSIEIKPGEKIEKSLLSKLKKMEPGTRTIETLGPNSTVELIKNPRGESFVLVKFQGETTRGVSVDSDGIAHKASDVQMFGADMNFSNAQREKAPAFKVETSRPQEKSERKIEKNEKKTASIQAEELTDLTDEAELEEDEAAPGSLLDLEAQKQEVKLGELAYNPDKGPIKLRTVGKRDTLYNALVRDFAAREGINIVTNRKAAVAKVESWLNEMSSKKLNADIGGKKEPVNDLKEILQRPGQSEITLSIE